MNRSVRRIFIAVGLLILAGTVTVLARQKADPLTCLHKTKPQEVKALYFDGTRKSMECFDAPEGLFVYSFHSSHANDETKMLLCIGRIGDRVIYVKPGDVVIQYSPTHYDKIWWFDSGKVLTDPMFGDPVIKADMIRKHVTQPPEEKP